MVILKDTDDGGLLELTCDCGNKILETGANDNVPCSVCGILWEIFYVGYSARRKTPFIPGNYSRRSRNGNNNDGDNSSDGDISADDRDAVLQTLRERSGGRPAHQEEGPKRGL